MQTELYEFSTQAATYRYTSGSEDVSAWGVTFTAAALGRSNLEASDDLNRASLGIVASCDLPYVTAALTAIDHGSVAIFAWNGTTSAWDTVWRARVVTLTLAGAEAQISTQSVLTEPRHLGLYGKFQAMCRHPLYGIACGVDRTAYDFTGAVSVISGLDVTVPGVTAETDGYYTYGVADFGIRGSSLVTNHVGDVLTLFALVPGLIVGDVATVYAGCDRLFATCLARFDNALNFGGFPWLPLATVKGNVPLLGQRRWR